MLNIKKYPKAEIYREMLKRISHQTLLKYIASNKALQMKCNVYTITKEKCPKDLIIDGMLELYPKISEIEKFIVYKFSMAVNKDTIFVSKLKDKEEIKEYFSSEKYNKDKFSEAVILWLQKDEEINKLGDCCYEMFLKENSKNKEIINKGGKDFQMDSIVEKNKSSVFEMTLGDCINIITEYKKKNDELHNELENKEKEISRLREKAAESVKSNKEKNKIVNELSDKILKVSEEINQKIKASDEKHKTQIEAVEKLCLMLAEERKADSKTINNLAFQNSKLQELIKNSEVEIKNKLSQGKTDLAEELRLMINEEKDDVKINEADDKKDVNNEKNLKENNTSSFASISEPDIDVQSMLDDLSEELRGK